MSRILRPVLLVASAIQAFFALAFFFQMPFALQLWPFPQTGALSYFLVSSIFLAAAASTVWCLMMKEDGALAGIGLDYAVMFAPIAVFTFQAAGQSGAIALFGVSAVIAGLVGLGLFLWSQRIPFVDARPQPALVRGSFVVFIVALIIVGVRLITGVSNTLPWALTPELSALFGWFFIGAAAYFSYGLLRPGWANTGGQLAGFLAYDIVLIVPFVQRLSTVAEEFRLQLIIYTLVVVYSGLLAIYYLFINPSTRFGAARRIAPVAA
ncbi:MAG: hypothetical protein IT320_11480 [Anaerolineae bacterium]|nr:hypothetical protein [Anaerolineae bacterium]